MKTIWKYTLDLTEAPADQMYTFEIPAAGWFLRCGPDPVGPVKEWFTANPAMWFFISSVSPVITRTFTIIETGHATPEKGDYLGTALCGSFAWHIFEIPYLEQRT